VTTEDVHIEHDDGWLTVRLESRRWSNKFRFLITDYSEWDNHHREATVARPEEHIQQGESYTLSVDDVPERVKRLLVADGYTLEEK